MYEHLIGKKFKKVDRLGWGSTYSVRRISDEGLQVHVFEDGLFLSVYPIKDFLKKFCEWPLIIKEDETFRGQKEDVLDFLIETGCWYSEN